MIEKHWMKFSLAFFSPMEELIKLVTGILGFSLNEILRLVFFKKFFIVLDDFFVIFSDGFWLVKEVRCFVGWGEVFGYFFL